MCFQEKGLFTQEVLAIVINQLIESVPLPTLFMRTVIQSFTIHPKLLGFVISILQRLIAKQVYKLFVMFYIYIIITIYILYQYISCYLYFCQVYNVG